MSEAHEVSGGNVFADMGFPDSEQELLKAKLVLQIIGCLKRAIFPRMRPRDCSDRRGRGLPR